MVLTDDGCLEERTTKNNENQRNKYTKEVKDVRKKDPKNACRGRVGLGSDGKEDKKRQTG